MGAHESMECLNTIDAHVSAALGPRTAALDCSCVPCSRLGLEQQDTWQALLDPGEALTTKRLDGRLPTVAS